MKLGIIFSFIFLLAVFGLRYAISFPSVQNKIIDKITGTLSEKIGTEVGIDSVYLELWSNLAFEGIYIEDQHQDTLLYARYLETGFESGLVDIFILAFYDEKQFRIDYFSIDDAQFNLKRYSGDLHTNLQFLIDSLGGNGGGLGNFQLDIGEFDLSNVLFTKNDSLWGSNMSVYLTEGIGEVEDFDLPKKKFSFSSFQADGLDFQITLFAPLENADLNIPVVEKNDAADSIFLGAAVHNFELSNSHFKLDNYRKVPWPGEKRIDFQHLDIGDIQIQIDSFTYSDEIYHGTVNQISALSLNDGFKLNNLSGETTVGPRGVEINKLALVTDNTILGDTLTFKYREYTDFWDFPNKVYIKAKFNNSTLRMNDLMAFLPGLENNGFFKKHRNEDIKIDGEVYGKVNSLKGDDLKISLGENTFIKGEFRSRDLLEKGGEVLNLNLAKSFTTINDIKLLVPNLKLPPNFSKLGTLNFEGKFDGFFRDFVAYGELETNIGKVRTDLRMNLKEGGSLARYSGKLSLDAFDLAKWMDNTQFGTISFETDIVGTGLTASTINADVDGTLNKFSFRGYQYEDVLLKGNFKQFKFDLDTFLIQDPNMDLQFSGSVDFNDSIPSFDFISKINALNLKELNLIEKNLGLRGNITGDFSGNQVQDFEGKAIISDFEIVLDTQSFEIAALDLDVERKGINRRLVTLRSDILDADVDGTFDTQTLLNDVLWYVEDNFPAFAKRANIQPKKVKSDTLYVFKDGLDGYEIRETVINRGNQQFNFNLSLKDSRNLFEILGWKINPLKDAYAVGFMNTKDNLLKLQANVPSLSSSGWRVSNVNVKADIKGDNGPLELSLEKLKLTDSLEIPYASLKANLAEESIDFNLDVGDVKRIVTNMNFNGNLSLYEDIFELKFKGSEFEVFDNTWVLEEDNYVRFGPKKLETQNFLIRSGEKKIAFFSEGDKGMKMLVQNIEIGHFERIAKTKNFTFGGVVNAEVSVTDLFSLEGMEARIEMDSLIGNGDNWGELLVLGKTASLKEKIDLQLSFKGSIWGKFKHYVKLDGFYVPPQAATKEWPKNSISATLQSKNIPIQFAEYLIPDGVSNTGGFVDLNVNISGLINKPILNGKGDLNNAITKINYLGTTYRVPYGEVTITNDLFDFSGVKLLDEQGNTATVIGNSKGKNGPGGIRHELLKNYTLDAAIVSDKFLFLKTKEGHNDIYYGTAIGSGRVAFSGSFRKTDISVDATSGKGTKVSIPISYDQTASEIDFITFIDKSNDEEGNLKKVNTEDYSEIRGVNINMDLNITDDAEIRLIFDERVGDQILGVGKGNIQISVERTGYYEMFGTYVISKGEYLFTYQSLINKPFFVKPGGTIKWSGDPFNAQLNLEAVYSDLSTSPYNLILEYLTEQETNLASKQTKVNLTMDLTGDLLKPNIDFEIEMPSVDLNLRSYVDTKLRTLKEDKNEMNRQVFGLIVTGSFLPTSSNFVLQGNQVVTGINTLSEVISNQLSNYITDLLSEFIEGGDLLSGMDFDFNYRVDQIAGTDDVSLNDGAVQLGLKNYLFNKRLIVNLGGNVDLGNRYTPNPLGNSGAYLQGDIVFEYLLSADGRFKVRAYQQAEDGIGFKQNKTGVGFSYNQEFDTFAEFIEGFKRSIKPEKPK